MTAHRILADEYRMLETASNRGTDPGAYGTLELGGETDVLFVIEAGPVYAPDPNQHPLGTQFTVMSASGNVVNVARTTDLDYRLGVVASGEALECVLTAGAYDGSTGWLATHYE